MGVHRIENGNMNDEKFLSGIVVESWGDEKADSSKDPNLDFEITRWKAILADPNSNISEDDRAGIERKLVVLTELRKQEQK